MRPCALSFARDPFPGAFRLARIGGAGRRPGERGRGRPIRRSFFGGSALPFTGREGKPRKAGLRYGALKIKINTS